MKNRANIRLSELLSIAPHQKNPSWQKRMGFVFLRGAFAESSAAFHAVMQLVRISLYPPGCSTFLIGRRLRSRSITSAQEEHLKPVP